MAYRFLHKPFSSEFGLGDYIVKGISKNYLGSGVPIWGIIIRYYWIFIIYVVGICLVLPGLLKLRKISSIQQVGLGIAIGVGAQGIISFIAGGGNIMRFFTYVSIPLLMIFLGNISNLKQRTKTYICGGLVVLLFALSFPSFLLNNNSINLNAFNRASEENSAKFLANTYADGDGLFIFAQCIPWQAYFPLAVYHYPSPNYLPDFSVETFINAMSNEARFFSEHGFSAGMKGVWIKSKRDILDHRYVLGVDIGEMSNWKSMETTVAQQNKVYSNPEVEIFVRE